MRESSHLAHISMLHVGRNLFIGQFHNICEKKYDFFTPNVLHLNQLPMHTLIAQYRVFKISRFDFVRSVTFINQNLV